MLEVQGLRVRYGKLEAVRGVSLVVPSGGFVALLGRNGAGKSSTIRAVSGLIKSKSGVITFDGKRLDHCSAATAVREGIAVVPEGRQLFETLSVHDNLRLGAYSKVQKGWKVVFCRSQPLIEERVEEVLELMPELRPLMRQSAGSLSGGQQQMVAVGRALMARPSLLIVDELSLGLAPQVVARILEHLVRLNEGGTSILLVEQNIQLALETATYAYLMEGGVIRYEGVASELVSDEVGSSYFDVVGAELA